MQQVDVPRSGQIKAIAELKKNGVVRSVDRNYTRTVNADPLPDPRIGEQWNLTQIDWFSAYGSITIGGNAVVAVLDTGVVTSHPDLAGQFDDSANFYNAIDPSVSMVDPNGHGTAMAGIIAAGVDNGTGIAGVAYDGVTIMPVTVIGADGTGRDIDIIAGINWAVMHGADVILMAFSSPGQSAALEAAVNDAVYTNGVTVVASVANDGVADASYPAGFAGVIGVGATDQDDNIASFSNTGASVFMSAPGVDILASGRGGGAKFISGASTAAAEVAGAAGLIRANDDSLTPSQVAGALSSSAAGGRLDLDGALLASGAAPVDIDKDDRGLVDENPVYVVGADPKPDPDADTRLPRPRRPRRRRPGPRHPA